MGEKAAGVFKRYEVKYGVAGSKFAELEKRLRERMHNDVFAAYQVGNIYFDTPDYSLIRSSLEKPVYKEKLRLRAYGTPAENSDVFLELKKKYRDVVYKRREALTLTDARDYLETGSYAPEPGQIHREIDWAMRLYEPEPKMLVAYDRIALVGDDDPELRLTFDRNIRYRTERLELSAGFDGETVTGRDEYIMEIKFDLAMPLWLSGVLSELGIFRTTFSKYGVCYLTECEKASALRRSPRGAGAAVTPYAGATEMVREAAGNA